MVLDERIPSGCPGKNLGGFECDSVITWLGGLGICGCGCGEGPGLNRIHTVTLACSDSSQLHYLALPIASVSEPSAWCSRLWGTYL